MGLGNGNIHMVSYCNEHKPVLITTVKLEQLFASSPKLALIMYIKYYFEGVGDQKQAKTT